MSHPRRKNLRDRKLHVERLEERALLVGDLELLADINEAITAAGSSPYDLTAVGQVVYFTARTDDYGRELWKTDGTTEGTVLVKDILSGVASSAPAFLTNVAGTLFFSANSGTAGTELWKSDGTSSGTVLVKDIASGGSSSPFYLNNLGGTLLFVANDGNSGTELWRSDGTEEGTARVTDIFPGSSGAFDLQRQQPTLRSMTIFGNNAYFAANDGSHGVELWRSDGTAAGTSLVKDIQPGTGSALGYFLYRPQLVNANGTLFLFADDGSNGRELWKSDGTEAGTLVVKDIRPGAAGSSGAQLQTAQLVNVGGTVLFNANDGVSGFELWRSDGTATGTSLVRDIRLGVAHSILGVGSGFSPRNIFSTFSDRVFFTANNGASSVELWKSDGTESGTVLVKDIFPGTTSSNPSSLTNIGGILYFAASDGVNGQELWRSDGTEAGTYLVQDLTGDSGGSSPVPFDFGGRLVVIATTEATGRELFIEVIPGDFNRDNVVTTADYDYWRDNFSATTAPGLRADANHDGLVDTADYTIWRDNYVPPVPIATATSAAIITPPLARDLARNSATTHGAHREFTPPPHRPLTHRCERRRLRRPRP